ncbi:multiple sugar transport system permease protein [Palleronia aestuarii]|uniref:Multiple sugar transport system permease protein n=1 Tax=Palleronia aestuarii TaxID=568105 RepID=A0A2W7NAF2_9RHOB|nr:sugar ABC transporter permease [Palleronia aestuarii]PZX17058.1 multiple sugar transport system permease protein [Palleronia aestuarii]
MERRPKEFDPAGGGWAPWLFLSPLLVFAALFFVLPLGFSVYLSFTRWNPLGTPDWVGLRQFEYLLTRDTTFWATILNTFVFAFGFVVAGVPLALGLAFVFSRARGKAVWRSVYYLPQLTNIVAIAYLWQFVLDDRYGLVNRLLGMAGLRGPDWLTDPVMAMISVVMVMVWYDAGKNMLVFSAALEAVDQEIYDAATLDGAGATRTLWSVTLPMIRPAFIFVTITSFITGMGFFALILAMTGGGPRGATEVTALYTYRMAFEDLRMGRASAGALILFVIIGVISLLQFRALKERAT